MPSLAGIKDMDSVHKSVLTKANVRAHERRFGKGDIQSKIDESRNSFKMYSKPAEMSINSDRAEI